jgi:hypothetical protein
MERERGRGGVVRVTAGADIASQGIGIKRKLADGVEGDDAACPCSTSSAARQRLSGRIGGGTALYWGITVKLVELGGLA